MHSSSRRTLLAALTISLLLHGALLLSTVTPFAVKPRMPAVTVNALLTREQRDEAPPLPPAPAKIRPPAAPPAPPSASAALPRQARAGAPTIAVEQASAPSPPAPPAPPAAAAARDGGAPVSSALPAAGAPATAASASAPAKPVLGEALNADDLRQYSVALGLAARRFKRYPALARERGWEGRAEIELVFDALLSRPQVSLARSSGRAVLDEQAVDMMTQATRSASLPEGLRGRSFRLLKVVEFSLEGDR